MSLVMKMLQNPVVNVHCVKLFWIRDLEQSRRSVKSPDLKKTTRKRSPKHQGSGAKSGSEEDNEEWITKTSGIWSRVRVWRRHRGMDLPNIKDLEQSQSLKKTAGNGSPKHQGSGAKSGSEEDSGEWITQASGIWGRVRV